ncbi:hypothetical protein, partial [Alginatibacterium sediminis]|uniref:hypothetical protein n=1 Tax=Alginatibacterium sediminis TaxID=2164068 RepID=UPI001F48CAD7
CLSLDKPFFGMLNIKNQIQKKQHKAGYLLAEWTGLNGGAQPRDPACIACLSLDKPFFGMLNIKNQIQKNQHKAGYLLAEWTGLNGGAQP